MRFVRNVLPLLLVLVLHACATKSRPPVPATRQFTFAWPFRDGDGVAPRGGTTPGAPVELDTTPGAAWQQLQAPGLTALERDRRAILAMAGTYRSSFDFLEVVGFRPGFVPERPYQSGGTACGYV